MPSEFPTAMSQWNNARLNHCTVLRTAIACQQFIHDDDYCLNIALAAGPALLSERMLIKRGEAPSTAERSAIEQGVTEDVAKAAIDAPSWMTSVQFSSLVMMYCLKSLGQ